MSYNALFFGTFSPLITGYQMYHNYFRILLLSWDTVLLVTYRDMRSDLLEYYTRFGSMRVSYKAIIFFAGLASYTIFEKVVGLLEAYTTELLPYFTYLDLGLVIVAIIGSIVWAVKTKNAEKRELPSENVTSPVLPERRISYHEHVEGLFETITKNLNPLLKTDENYFQALRKTTEKKRMIFQHFRTIDLISQEYSTLFAMYKVSVAELNDLEKRKKNVLLQIAEFDRKLQEYYSNNNDETNWLNFEALRSAIGIKHNDPLESGLKDLPEYRFPNSISCDFYIVEKNNESQLGVSNNWFARSKNKERLKHLKDFIYEHGYTIMQEVSSIHSVYHTMYSFSVPMFNKQFKEFKESLEGEPILGACISCLIWLNAENQKKYKPILDEFNSTMSNYEESLWSNEQNF